MNPNSFAPAQILPADFDGTFRFTNWTDRDFSAKWGGKEYHFPALKTTPMIILSATPYEIQNIRKKFAKELAEREFFISAKYSKLNAMNENPGRSGGIASAVGYNPGELEPLVQKCLEPLPIAVPTVSDVPNANKEFTPKVTKRVKARVSGDNEDDSLVGNGQVIA